MSFWRDTAGVAAVELALVLPILAALMLGIVDGGSALLLNKKVLSAAQISADLITRNPTVSSSDISDSITAAQMAVQPYNDSLLGVDIVSIQFVGTTATPTILWRQTTANMTANPNVLTLAKGLGVQNEGVVIVTTFYHFSPTFTNGFIGPLDMQEVAVTRGRRAPIVTKS